MALPAGTHPTIADALQIVFASCAKEFPNATQNDTVGAMYPLASQRAIFATRIVQNASNAGFQISPAKIPTGDTDTLATVAAAVMNNAKA